MFIKLSKEDILEFCVEIMYIQMEWNVVLHLRSGVTCVD